MENMFFELAFLRDTMSDKVGTTRKIRFYPERRKESMAILCILIFPFAVLAELMKMNNGGGKRRR